MIFQERAKKNYDVEFHIGKHIILKTHMNVP